MLFQWILKVILAFPAYHADSELFGKTEQLASAAQSIEESALATKWPGPKSELAGLLLTVGEHESGFSEAIGRGECKPYQCDHGRAAGYYQLHEAACSSRAAWESARTDPRIATLEAARALARARNLCRSLEGKDDWVRMTLSAYAGRGCKGGFRGLDKRVETFKRVMRIAL